MVINYKQLRKRERLRESFRRNEDLTPLVRLAQGIVDAYEISLELPSQTWTDSDGNRQHYVSCGLEAAEGFRRMPLSQIPAATPKARGSNDERKLTFTVLKRWLTTHLAKSRSCTLLFRSQCITMKYRFALIIISCHLKKVIHPTPPFVKPFNITFSLKLIISSLTAPRKWFNSGKKDGPSRGCFFIKKSIRVKTDHLFAKPAIDVLHSLHDGHQLVNCVNPRCLLHIAKRTFFTSIAPSVAAERGAQPAHHHGMPP